MFKNLHPILNVIILSLLAGLGTSIGGLIAIIQKPGRKVYGLLMGITAGVMICLSFLELVNETWEQAGWLTAAIGFTLGAVFMFIIDHFAPHMRFGEVETRDGNCPEPAPKGRHHGWRRGLGMGGIGRGQHIHNKRMLRTGLLLAVGISIHNLPEGIAVGAGYVHQPSFGIFIAIAIMLHNIPEGIATALPLCQSGLNKWQSFRVAMFSGLVEPIGALLAALLLSNFTSFIPGALAFAGGVMVFITLDELVPTAREHGHEHYTAFGIILGSLLVFLLSGIFGV